MSFRDLEEFTPNVVTTDPGSVQLLLLYVRITPAQFVRGCAGVDALPVDSAIYWLITFMNVRFDVSIRDYLRALHYYCSDCHVVFM